MGKYLSLAAVAIAILAITGMGQQEPDVSESQTDASDIFENRIMPIFRSAEPSSCVQCHLSSVDLKNYILPSHEKTFVSLRDQGLIDLDDVRSSKILNLIDMGAKDADSTAKRIHEEMRNLEYEAFAMWIEACVADKRIRDLPTLNETELARPAHPDSVIRHARKSRVVDSFARNVWSQRLRCFPCHTPHEIKPNQKPARKKFEEWQSQFGERMLIFRDTPEATIQYLVERSQEVAEDELPMLNLQDPANSLLIQKPISKLPPREDGKFLEPAYTLPVSHRGGLKIHVDDQSYKSFVAWIQDYANVVNGSYTSVEDLPADNWYATRRVLRLRELPEHVSVGTPVQLVVYPPNDDSEGTGKPEWSSDPIAFTQGTVTPKRIVNGSLFLLAPGDAHQFEEWKSRKNRLPPGSYLVKVFADNQGVLDQNPTLMLGDDAFLGQVVINSAKWRVGFPRAEWISGVDLTSGSE